MSHASLFDLSDRTALVTGGGRGLGCSMALALADAGADVVIADLNADTANQVSETIQEMGKKSLSFQVDVSDADQVDNLMQEVIANWGRLDILVNNAGINCRRPILDLKPEELDSVYEVNFKGVFNCSKRAAIEMISTGYGKIINIASITALKIIQGLDMLPYYMTKASVVQFTKAAASEWAEHGIRVNAISPGWFVTDINRSLWENQDYCAMRQNQTPLGRIGEPEDLNGTVVFLSAPASDFITGQNIVVDGGFMLW